MGTTTPNIGIYLPAAGETGYNQSFDAGMINIDQHDHSGGPNKGVPIPSSGIADFSITYNKLNANVVDLTTGIGVSATLPNQLQILGLLKNIFQIATVSGFISKDGSLAHARTLQAGDGISIANGNGVAGDPVISAAAGNVIGTTNQIAVTQPAPGVNQVALAATVVNTTQPGFLATVTLPQNNITGDGTTAQVLFGNEVFDQSSNYNPATSEFTAPIDGIYNLEVNLTLTGLNAITCISSLMFYKNGVLFYTIDRSMQTTTATLNSSKIMKLTATDVITVFINVTGVALTGSVTDGSFTGVLLW